MRAEVHQYRRIASYGSFRHSFCLSISAALRSWTWQSLCLHFVLANCISQTSFMTAKKQKERLFDNRSKNSRVHPRVLHKVRTFFMSMVSLAWDIYDQTASRLPSQPIYWNDRRIARKHTSHRQNCFITCSELEVYLRSIRPYRQLSFPKKQLSFVLWRILIASNSSPSPTKYHLPSPGIWQTN